MSAINMKVYPQNPHDRVINKAVEILDDQGLIVYPTDTIYGLGAKITSKRAVERIYRIKKVASGKLLSFICPDLRGLARYARISDRAYKIMRRCLPGPYTFILPATKLVPKILFQNRRTVGIRIPDSELCRQLVKKLGTPIISTSVPGSANEFLNDPETIYQRLHNLIDMLLDGGILISDPSTIVDLTGYEPAIIRQGAGDISLIY